MAESGAPNSRDASKNADRIAGMFDAIAPNYDFLNHLLSAGIDRRWRRRAIESLRLTGSERVLDLCSGTGDLAIAAQTATPGAARVVGVDFANAMLRLGRDKLRRRGLDRSIILVRGDAAHVPLGDGSVDAVTVAFGIRNVESVDAVCAEMHRVLKPGGRVALLEFSTPTLPIVRTVYAVYFHQVLPRIGQLLSHHNAAYGYLPASVDAFLSPAEFRHILERSGFVSVEAVPLTFGIVFLYTGCRG